MISPCTVCLKSFSRIQKRHSDNSFCHFLIFQSSVWNAFTASELFLIMSHDCLSHDRWDRIDWHVYQMPMSTT